MARPLPLGYADAFRPVPPAEDGPQWAARARLLAKHLRAAADLVDLLTDDLALPPETPTPLPVPRWAGLREAAAVTGYSMDRLRRWARQGAIVARQDGDGAAPQWRVRLGADGRVVRAQDRPAPDPSASLASSLPPEAGNPAATATAAPASGAALWEGV